MFNCNCKSPRNVLYVSVPWAWLGIVVIVCTIAVWMELSISIVRPSYNGFLLPRRTKCCQGGSIILSEIFSFTYKIIPGSEVRMFILEMTGWLLITITPRVVKIVRIAAAN